MPPLGNMAGEIDSPANRARMQHQVGQIARQHQATTTGTTITGGTMDVWPQWNITYTTSANTSTATMITVQDNRQIWTAWNQGITSAVTYTTGITTATTNDWTIPNPLNTITWEVFNDRYERIQAAVQAGGQIQRYSRRKLSEEELLVELEREKKLREEAEARVLKAKMAEARAERLLRSCLSEQQVEDLDKKGSFYIEIQAANGKKERYRIDRGSHGNVKQVDEKGSIVRSFCIQPSGVPVPDVMLSQKLYLEASDETRAKFWETANITDMMREKAIPAHIPRPQRHQYARQHGLLH